MPLTRSYAAFRNDLAHRPMMDPLQHARRVKSGHADILVGDLSFRVSVVEMR